MATDELFAKVTARLQELAPEMVELQRELVRRVAVGPDAGGPGEGEKAAYLAELLARLGLEVRHFPAPDPRVPGGVRPNLVAFLPGQGAGKVWVLSHLDVVPPGDLSLWDSDPFTLRVEGDRLYGRGTEDNHHGIVASLMAVRALMEVGATPARTVALALVADEETGSAKGLDFLLREHGELFHPQDLIIVPDAGSPDGSMIEVAEKSLLWLKLTLMGKQCHASRPELGHNTLRAAAHAIVALEGLTKEFPGENPLFRPPTSTFEPTKVEANVPNVNTIPGRDVFYLDCRVLPEYGVEEVKARVVALASEAARPFGVTVSLEVVQEQPAAPVTDPEAPVVRALTRAIRAVRAGEATPQGIGGGTVAAFFRRRGLPAAVWMTVSETAHQPNEYCRLSTLVGDAQVLAHVYLYGD